jgi:hypothetical protein
MESKFVDLVPTEEVVEIKMDRRRRQSVGFPGYVLVEMVMDDETLALGEAHQQGHRFCWWRENAQRQYPSLMFRRSNQMQVGTESHASKGIRDW